ncbi:testicular haploid expressed gene protein-like [Ylistrum balloti]|uniref:testicular haploid expressed gene protein-like n=1 Tax=Ylistrum balloti TaxID=509963 RepID=UPI002905C032|nr:testicular haploid expressed gene protein-like [Ylistrum balloti]
MSVKSEGYTRIGSLSLAKRAPPEFQEDRRSVYWVDRLPPTPQREGKTTEFVTSSRIEALSQPRRAALYKGDRPGPIWPVSTSALKACCPPRLEQLGQAKNLQYYFDRSPYMMVTPGARSAEPSSRLKQLSQPLARKQVQEHREVEWGQTFPVTESSKKAVASARVEQLAEAKGYNKYFRDEKPVQWGVTESALNATANVRLQQLARPLSRTMIKDDYDPYKVSAAARRVHATPRIEELCVPIPRKVRPKKA